MSAQTRQSRSVDVAELLQELVDAHVDTVEIALAARPEEDWRSHVEYLQRLIRCARESFATQSAANG